MDASPCGLGTISRTVRDALPARSMRISIAQRPTRTIAFVSGSMIEASPL
jgi:hypothetical protein